MAKAQQQQIPGTEPKKLPPLIKAAEAYRGIVRERLDLQTKEAEHKTKLMELCRKYEKSGDLTINPDQITAGVEPVYHYTVEEDGEMVNRVIKHGYAEGVSVVKGKEPD